MAGEIGVGIFCFILLVIFSQNIGLVFIIKVVSNMLKFHIYDVEITNRQMLQVVLFSLVYACIHLIQCFAYICGIVLKCLLAYLFNKMGQTK